MPPGGAPGNMS